MGGFLPFSFLILNCISALAQANPNPPERLTYQGFLADGNGVALATNAPKNYDVVFRLWDDASATAPANRLWTEQQTVTVDKGFFSVLLGEGTGIGGEGHGALSTLFTNATASDRFVEMTVKGIGAAGADVKILPRLRLLTSPYAYLAAKAINAVNANNATTANTANSVAGSAISGTVSDARLSPNVALLNRNSQAFTGNNTFAGNVGIGTTTPQAALHVAGINGIALGVNWATGGYTALQMSLSSVFDGYAQIQAIKRSGLDLGNLILNPEGGNVGIGTTTPTQAKLVVKGSTSYIRTGSFGTFENLSPAAYQTGGNPTTTQILSIYASDTIMAYKYIATSDSRIKRIEGRSDAARDLAVLAGIQVTDYTYIDTISKGTGKQKKVIAQQVEKVYPQAVSRSTDVVPDIYQKAEFKDGWVKLATNLKKGERVRILGDKKEGIHEVLEVAGGCFRTDFKPEGDKVFVYGREVNDFRSVDYEAISMLNVSATQELAKRLEKLEKRETHLAELEQKAARVETLEQEVADLKKLVAQLAADSKSAKLAAQATKQTHAAANATAEKAFTTASLVR